MAGQSSASGPGSTSDDEAKRRVAEVFNRLAPAYGTVIGYFDHFGAKLVEFVLSTGVRPLIERLRPADQAELQQRVVAGLGDASLTVPLSARFWLAAG
ncbi:MAG TPA: hypothetical protein VFA94_13905 [Acidimicrobiales bacterium]|nr:hypothetical protein [Acidimicrobiales bacterium]